MKLKFLILQVKTKVPWISTGSGSDSDRHGDTDRDNNSDRNIDSGSTLTVDQH